MTNKPKSNWNPNEYYKDQNVAESYDGKRFTSLAGRLFNWIEKRLVRRAFSSLPKGALLGDIPTGTGRLAEVLLEDGFQVVGLDISGDMLAVAARRLSRFGTMFRTEVCDARELKEKGYMFEGVLCARVLMHFPLDEQIVFLRNAAAAARHRIVFTQGIDTPYHRLRRSLKRMLRHQVPAGYPLTPEDLATLITKAGLREVKRTYVLPIVSEAMVIECVAASPGA